MTTMGTGKVLAGMSSSAISISERTQYRAIWDQIRAARDVLLVSPKRPDGDSIGAIVGIREALRAIGRDATAFCMDPIPPAYAGIPGVRDIVVGADRLRGRTFDIIVVCDAGDLEYTGIAPFLPAWRRPGSVFVVLDHHATSTAFGDVNCVVTDAASTTEVVWRMLTVNSVPVNPAAATALLLGLVYDTDGFRNPATTASSLHTASALTAAGGRLATVLTAVYRSKPTDAFRLWGRALERLHLDPATDIVTTVVIPDDFREFPEGTGAVGGLSNFLQAAIPARAILVLKDDGTGMVRGSLRTHREDVDAGTLAAALGGGGHRKAAGFGVPGRIVHRGDGWSVV